MKKFLLIVVGLIFLYRDAFFSRFFQDDFILLNLAKTTNALLPIQNFPYRPLSIQIFYSLGLNFFGDNPFGYHVLLFLIFVGALVFIYKLSNWQTTLIYAFNVSLFPLFYWVAASYFVFAAFFIFGSIYFYKNSKYCLAMLFFILGLLSNEIVIVLPILLLLIKLSKKITWFFVADLIYLVFRLQVAKFPTAADYALDFSTNFFSTFRWYFLRVFNLPEGRAAFNPLILILFILLVVILFACYKYFTVKKIIFAVVWFLIGALPFFFLPGHMSAYYLTISLFGPALLFGEVIAKNKFIGLCFVLIYIMMSVIGLDALSQTHWIILK